MLEGLTPENVVLLAAAASVRLSKGVPAAQLEVLAAFFEIIGDNLALLALSSPGDE